MVLRRRSSSDLARQKFGTMPLLPIRGDDSGATLLSANQTLVRQPPHPALTPTRSLPLPLSHCRRNGVPASLVLLSATVTIHSTFSVPLLPTSNSCCQASLCLCVSPSPHPHLTCAQRRLHNRRTLSMFFVSTVPALATCLPALCFSALLDPWVFYVSDLMQVIRVCMCDREPTS